MSFWERLEPQISQACLTVALACFTVALVLACAKNPDGSMNWTQTYKNTQEVRAAWCEEFLAGHTGPAHTRAVEEIRQAKGDEAAADYEAYTVMYAARCQRKLAARDAQTP